MQVIESGGQCLIRGGAFLTVFGVVIFEAHRNGTLLVVTVCFGIARRVVPRCSMALVPDSRR